MDEEVTKNTIRIAQVLGIETNQVSKLFDIMSLTDLAALISYVNSGDEGDAQTVFKQYSDQLINDVQSTEDEPVEENIMQDAEVSDAVNNVNEMLEGGKTRYKIMELAPFWRRMFYGEIPPSVSKVIQKTIDLSPIAITQAHAKMRGYGFSAMKEGQIGLNQMSEELIEHALNSMKEDFLDGVDNKKKEEEKSKEEPKDDDKKEPEKKADDKEDSATKTLIDSIVQKQF